MVHAAEVVEIAGEKLTLRIIERTTGEGEGCVEPQLLHKQTRELEGYRVYS